MIFNKFLEKMEAFECFSEEHYNFNDEPIKNITEIKLTERKLKSWEFTIDLDRFYDIPENHGYFNYFDIEGYRKLRTKQEVSKLGFSIGRDIRAVTIKEKRDQWHSFSVRGRFHDDHYDSKRLEMFQKIKNQILEWFPNATVKEKT